MNTLTNTQEKVRTQEKQLDNILLQGVMEGVVNGVLVLTEQGEWIYANNLARQICNQLTHDKSQPNAVPIEIWRMCKALIDSRKSYPDQLFIMESEITTDDLTEFQIRARWFQLDGAECPCILITLEEPCQLTQCFAIAEVKKYGLTPRQAEIWLLRRANYTYKEIAAELFITLNTVKKHVKNIRAKLERARFFSRARRRN